MASINSVSRVRADGHDPFAVIVSANITDSYGNTYDCDYCTRPEETEPPGSINGLFQQWLAENAGGYTVEPYVQPEPEPYKIEKMDLWLRLTPAEAEQVDAAMGSQPAQLRGVWNTAQTVMSNSEFFGVLSSFLTAVIGAARSAEVLSP